MKYKINDIVVVPPVGPLNSIKIKIIKIGSNNTYEYSYYKYNKLIHNQTFIIDSNWLDAYSELDNQYLRKEKLNELNEI